MKLYTNLLLGLLCCLSASQLSAQLAPQVEKVNFESFDIPDNARRVKIETDEDFEIRPWNGMQLMVETSVNLEGGNMDLLGVFIRDGRYSMVLEEGNEGALITFKSRLQKRSMVKFQGKMCYERIKIIIYVPCEFDAWDKDVFHRKEILVAGR